MLFTKIAKQPALLCTELQICLLHQVVNEGSGEFSPTTRSPNYGSRDYWLNTTHKLIPRISLR